MSIFHYIFMTLTSALLLDFRALWESWNRNHHPPVLSSYSLPPPDPNPDWSFPSESLGLLIASQNTHQGFTHLLYFFPTSHIVPTGAHLLVLCSGTGGLFLNAGASLGSVLSTGTQQVFTEHPLNERLTHAESTTEAEQAWAHWLCLSVSSVPSLLGIWAFRVPSPYSIWPYLPTIMSSLSDARGRMWVHRSMVKMVLELLNMEVREDMRAATITAIMSPRSPGRQKGGL